MVGDILSPTHLLFILVVALLVLGPKRLPEVGRSLGRGLRDFRAAMSGEDHDPRDEIMGPLSAETTTASPVSVDVTRPASPVSADVTQPASPVSADVTHPASPVSVEPEQPAGPVSVGAAQAASDPAEHTAS